MTCKICKLPNLFICLLSYLFFKVGSFTPEECLVHSTVCPFAPPWVYLTSLTQNAGIPFKSCWRTALLNNNEQTFYLFGGFMRNNLNQDAFVSNVHSFNLNCLSWSIPYIEGTTPERRSMKGVIDNTGKIYIFAELSWLIIPASKPTTQYFTVTMLSNGAIVYIGGLVLIEDTLRIVDIKNINLYDTKSQICYLFFKVGSFTPEGRLAHSTVLVENKLYFFGGYVDNANTCTNQVFYLDLSQSFILTAPPWVSLTQNAGIPFKSCWGTALLNDKEQTINLFGGLMRNDMRQDAFVSNVHSFNLNSLSWNVPNVKGTPPERRRNINGVIDNTGKIYIFGGYVDETLGSATLIRYNDMVILNTAELSWVIIPASKPYAQSSYTATMLSNGVIVYIGGLESLEDTATIVDIKNINLFDTNTLTWSVKIATASNIIQNPPDGKKIIIYGGAKSINDAQVVPDLFVLNMETEQFEFM
ncbi:11743_t:CDS:2, partial [Funneliformis geosporum]